MDVLPFDNIDAVIRHTEYSSIRAIENADVFTAVNTIAGDVSGLPINVFEDTHQHHTGFEYLLNTEPNGVMDGKNLVYILIANAILNGNAYAEIERDDNGLPIALHYISNDRIYAVKKHMNRRHLKTLKYEVTDFGESGGTRKLDAQDILHIKPFSIDGLTGKSPLIALKDDIESQRNAKRFFNNFFRNGTQSGGIIKVAGDLNSDDKEAIRKEWQKQNAGEDNAHKVSVLDEGMTYDPIKVDTEILKLINDSKHNTVQVAKVLGMPLHKMKIETHSQSLEEANSDYVINTLNNYISALEYELNRKLFRDRAVRQRYNIKLNTDVYKYADAKTKHDIVKAKYEMGLISDEEARLALGHPPTGRPARFIQSLNYMNSELIDEYQLKRVDSVQNNVTEEGGETND